MGKQLRVEGVSEAVDQMMSAEAWICITATRTDEGSHIFDMLYSNPLAMHALLQFAQTHADDWLDGARATTETDEDDE